MTHDLHAHVKATIRGVLREMGLLGRPPRKTGPRVLFLLHGGNPRQDLATEQIRIMEQAAGKSSLFLADASQFCECEQDIKEASGARCLLSDLPPESFDKVLNLADWLVLPAMPLTTAAGAAGLNGPANCRLIKAMLAGKKILVADDAFRQPGVAYAPALEQRIAEIMETLRGYGMVTAPMDSLAEAFARAAAIPAAPTAPAMDDGKPAGQALAYVSAAQVRDALTAGKTSLRVAARGKIGPLAKDLAREGGLKLEREPDH